MRLYHGSNVMIDKPDLSRSKPFKDFGRGFICVMILQVLSAFAGGDEVHAGENQYDCGGFYQVEGLHSAAYRHNAGDDGLDIVVHAGHGRAQVFLSYHYEHVADEGRAYHDEQDAGYGLGCQLVPSGGHQLVRREREDADEGVGEQPFYRGEEGGSIFVQKTILK